MQLDVSAEVILSQLGYSINESSLKQAQKMIESTKNFDKFAKHILTLNDQIKKMNAYIALSNTTDYLKIKCDENDAREIIEDFHDMVSKWANKYNVEIERVSKKPTYYILGIN
ncbi:hypothetical protein ACNSOP_00845 [Aliarcobacter lanthieri]|uniref:hypothetical protein n=1 Tax=Arcobacteraceae TaxID=2808963 RepID=UPI000DEB1516|nr:MULTISPECIES: hypothetical protein [Arcobacteraceae]MBL3519458.1 hypothetical protein [Aliarcobacter lanthieri]RBQ26976.1 hypothetical protein CRU88_04360 [Arcobacter sp. CECT 9188]